MSRLHDAARTDPRPIGVTVILSAALRRRRPGSGDGPERHVFAAGATLADLLAALGIDAATDLTAAVDGELAERDTPLRDGAEVMLLVPMEGGAAAEGEATIRNAVEGGAAAEGEATMRNAVKGICSKPYQQRGK
ncbi:MAG TPA: MoaD/ThiS family protein [Candidatus Nitrosotalea sp.]|nr:MoaD/ThiS family protein [Candidatus Nitrosotalea sp.]